MTTKISGPVRASLLLGLLALAAAGCGSMSSSGGGSTGSASAGTALSTTHSAKLSATVLVNAKGMTLYTLSAERGGKFICTKSSMIPGGSASCVSLWKPVLTTGGAPVGVAGLSTIHRPDGLGTQVTYHGLPLYSFTGDHAAGDAAGNGFKDVGTWKAATTSGGSAPATAGGGGYGY